MQILSYFLVHGRDRCLGDEILSLSLSSGGRYVVRIDGES